MTGGDDKNKKAKTDHGGEEQEVEEEDRLSHLPDEILLHILSFITDTRFCCRTSVVSKRWNFLWASVPHLIFNRLDFRKGSRFTKFVVGVLSRRRNLPVTKFSITYCGNRSVRLLTSMVNYAVSHNVQHLSLSLSFSAFKPLPLLWNCRSLKFLELKDVNDPHVLRYLSFPSLTTLSLTYCKFGTSPLDSTLFDPFVRNFKITGPLLDNLTILNRHNNVKVEIVAPKLRSFSLKEDTYDGVQFFGLDFPLLEAADMGLSFPSGKEARAKWRLDLMDMFRGLCNAQSLVLSSKIIKGLMKCPGVLEDQASPFVRLKTLKVKCHSSSFNIPHDVIKYFGENIKVEKILELQGF